MLLTEHGQDPFDQLKEIYKQNIEFYFENKNLVQRTDDEENSSQEGNQKQKMELESKLIEHICNGKAFIKLNSLFNFLDVLYKFIVYKLIPSTTLWDNNNQQGLDTDTIYNSELSLDDVISNDEFFDQIVSVDCEDENVKRLDLGLFNLSQIKLKNVYHVWKLLNRIYLKIKNNI